MHNMNLSYTCTTYFFSQKPTEEKATQIRGRILKPQQQFEMRADLVEKNTTSNNIEVFEHGSSVSYINFLHSMYTMRKHQPIGTDVTQLYTSSKRAWKLLLVHACASRGIDSFAFLVIVFCW